MPKKRIGLARRPLWILASHRNDRTEVLTIDPDGDSGGFVAVFGFEEEAEAFLGLFEHDRKGDWQIRETSKGELVSMLLGPCAGARWVALDPLPLPLGRAMLRLVSVDRERFVQELLQETRGTAGEPVPI